MIYYEVTKGETVRTSRRYWCLQTNIEVASGWIFHQSELSEKN